MKNALVARAVTAVVAAAGLAGPGAATAVADDCSNAQFRTGAAAGLPDCRAWEQVSPIDKNGNDIMSTSAVVSAADGNKAYFYAAGAFAGAETVTYETGYLGTRGQDWTTRGVDPPLSAVPSAMFIKSTLGLSKDGTKAVVVTGKALAPGAIEGGSNIYIRDLAQPHSYRLVAASSSPALYTELTGFGGQGVYLGGNSDLSAVAFTSTIPLVDGAPEGQRSAYLWHDGKLSLASRMPDGTHVEVAYQFADTPWRTRNQVSEDGTRLWFDAPIDGNAALRAIYQYVEGQGATLISRSHRAGDDPAVPVANNGAFASPDGRTITFEAGAPLAEDSTAAGAVYRWSASGDSLVDLTAPYTPASGPVPGIRLLQSSADRRFVWFQANRALTPDGETVNGAHLHVLDTASDQLHFVAGFDLEGNIPSIRFSANGRHVAFVSVSPVGGIDNTDPACFTLGTPQFDGYCGNVFTWSVDTPSKVPECLSCGPTGMRRNGPNASFGWLATYFDGRESRAVLDDGRVFFDSADQLLPGDSNSVGDVYEYRPGRGLALLSSGASGAPARFGDATEDGRSVFFVTADRLVPQDTDALGDLYAARVDGGIASQHVAPRDPAGACTGEACRPSLVAEPPRPVIGTPAFEAPTEGPSPRMSVRTPSRKELSAAGKRGRLSVRVKVSAGGTVRAKLTGKYAGKRNRTAARGTRNPSKAGTVRVSLKLSKAARRELSRNGRLRLRLTVEYSEDIKEYRRTVTLTKSRSTTSKKGGSR